MERGGGGDWWRWKGRGPPLDYRVPFGDFKERAGRLRPLNIAQPLGGLAHARVFVQAEHNGLEFRGIPSFGNNFDGKIVADGS